ncbi:MAG: DR2241 family protein [Halobacteriota archaeon]
MSDDPVALGRHQFDALLEKLDSAGSVAGEGLYVRYDSATDSYEFETPAVTAGGLTESELHERVVAHPAYVTTWYFDSVVLAAEPDHVAAFVRWVEGTDERDVSERYEALGDGIDASWGQLIVTARLDSSGRRRYEIRHEADADVDSDALETVEGPRAAREIGTYDPKGRYRPLRTAPSLPGGWVFEDLSPRSASEIVEAFYPATISNWHRERTGVLDVDHWRDTAARQSGIYAIVDELPEAAVGWMAAACCTDDQCLKRREWEYDATTDIDADGGSGVFPCREPCSLVIAAARKWSTLEREETHTYEFDLTPSEKAQLEAILEAVADGRIDEIREADLGHGANRYRARYLREKRMDERGHLSGTPPEPDDVEE